MTYLLDTNTRIRYLNGEAIGMLQKLRTLPVQEIVVYSVVKAELFFGAMKSSNPQQTLARQQLFLSRFVSLPFDDQAAEAYSRIRARLSAPGTPTRSNTPDLVGDVCVVRNTRPRLMLYDLIYCTEGISRSCVIGAAYLYECGMSLDDAVTLIRSRRPIVNPAPPLLRSLRDYYRIPE